jgi:spermidine/putrescine-binding protein
MNDLNRSRLLSALAAKTASLRLSRRYFMAGAATLSLGAALGRVTPAAAANDVVFVGWEGYDTAFNDPTILAKHGATFQATYINAIEDIITKLHGGGIGSVDLTTFIHQYVSFAGSAGMLDPIDESKIPNLSKIHPHFSAFDSLLKVDGKRYAVPFTYSSIPLMYNPAVVKEAPTSWLDMLKPEYKGKVAPYPDIMSMFVTWSRVANNTNDPTHMTKDQLEKAIDMMIQLKANSRTVPSSLGEISDMFIRGEIVMGMGWEPMVAWAKDKGVEIKIAYPKDGAFGYIDTVNIAKNAPNSDLDHELINHCISTQEQKVFSEANLLGIVNAEAMQQIDNPLLRSLYSFDDPAGYFKHNPVPTMFPLQPDGDYVVWDDVLAAYERYTRA